VLRIRGRRAEVEPVGLELVLVAVMQKCARVLVSQLLLASTAGAVGCDLFLGPRAAERATETAPPERETIVEGDVEATFPVSFRLDVEEGPRRGDQVLVLVDTGVEVPGEGTEVKVHGMLREVGVDDFEPIYGRPWDPHAGAFVGSRVLVLRADHLELTAR